MLKKSRFRTLNNPWIWHNNSCCRCLNLKSQCRKRHIIWHTYTQICPFNITKCYPLPSKHFVFYCCRIDGLKKMNLCYLKHIILRRACTGISFILNCYHLSKKNPRRDTCGVFRECYQKTWLPKVVQKLSYRCTASVGTYCLLSRSIVVSRLPCGRSFHPSLNRLN